MIDTDRLTSIVTSYNAQIADGSIDIEEMQAGAQAAIYAVRATGTTVDVGTLALLTMMFCIGRKYDTHGPVM